jgi:hypothetical protein
MINCWCAAYQCDGDANLDTQGAFPPYPRVFTNDLGVVIDNWGKLITDLTLNPCADTDHAEQGAFPPKPRVFTNDLGVVIDNWGALDSALPGDCPRPDGM